MNSLSKEVKNNQISILYEERCPECGNRELITDMEKGEIICRCGLVLKDNMLNQNPEWRAYTPEDKRQRERVGLPITITRHDMGLQTTFNIKNDQYGRMLPKNTRSKMMRLKRWQDTSKLGKRHENNLKKAMSELNMISDRLNLPLYIQQYASLIYRKALKVGMVRGRAIVDMVAASIYAACRINCMSRRLSDVTTACGRDKGRIAKYYRKMIIKLNLKIPLDEPAKYVAKISNILKIDPKIQNRAMELLREARGYAFLGKDPSGLAAALLYIASKEKGNHNKMSQMELAKCAGVSEVTIRNRVRGLRKVLNIKTAMDKK